MSRLTEYLETIRESAGLKNAILRGISVTKRTKTAEFFLVTDKAYTQNDEARAQSVTQSFLPSGFTAKMHIEKRVPDAEILKRKIHEYISATYPAAAAFLEKDSIVVEMLTSGANFVVDIASGEREFFSSGKILDDTSAYLSTVFCGTFYGTVRVVEKAYDESILTELPETEEEEISEIRRFAIENFVKIDTVDSIPKYATYIADADREDGAFAVCGTVSFIEEKEYTKHDEKTGEDIQKSRFSVAVTDGTGMLRTTYFPKKATVDKIRALQAGDKIVVMGENEEFKGNRSFKAGKIHYGTPPDGFVPVPRKGKPVPKFYHAVFPEPYEDFTQAGFFDSLDKPDDLKNNTFVVFDLETTGLNHNPAMGKMDKIIEIGAVKIVDGEMKEKFSSFVACKERLSKEIIDLTGIKDEDLVGAPDIERVMADFYKFIDGAYLVGQNVNFDYSFVRYYAEQSGYMMDCITFDTMTLAQELLRGQLANYKLNTIADYFGFTFNHHRAFDDACVTAKIFIEFIKRRGKLPL